jgi:hypothetical protein
VVFIESKWFTRRLLELAGEKAEDVLRAIQTHLLLLPSRGKVVPGLGGIRKGRWPIRVVPKEKGADFATFICSWFAEMTFTSCFSWTKMNKRI